MTKIKQMRGRVVLLLLHIFVVTNLAAQTNRYGVPFYKSYSVDLSGAAEYNHCITKDNNGILYIGNDGRGVIRYDGAEWSLIPVRNDRTIYSIASDKNNIIYVGGSDEFGYLAPEASGEMKYTSLAERVDTFDIRSVSSLLVMEDRVLFFANRTIFTYYPEKDTLICFDAAAKEYRNLLTAFVFDDRVFVSDNIHGVLEFLGDTLVKTPGGNSFEIMRIMAVLPYSSDEVLVITMNDGLFIYNIGTGVVNDRYLSQPLKERLKNVVIYRSIWIDDNHFALGTLSGEGVMVINSRGELVYQFNSQTLSIEDDLVMGIYFDNERGGELWINTIGQFTKVYVNLPFRSFSKKQGVVSGVNRIVEFNNTIYIGHDQGVSKLTTNDQGLACFVNVSDSIAYNTFALLLFRYSGDEFLIAGTQTGMFVIDKNDRVYNIESTFTSENREKRDVRTLLQPGGKGNIFIAGSTGRLLAVEYRGNGRWESIDERAKYQQFINQMAETVDGRLWYVDIAVNTVYSLLVTDGDTIFYEYDTEDGLPETVVGRFRLNVVDGQLLVTTPDGIYIYDNETDSFFQDEDLFGGFANNIEITGLLKDSNGDAWISFRKPGTTAFIEAYMPQYISVEDYILEPFNLLPGSPAWDIYEAQERIWLAKSKNLFVVDKEKLKSTDPKVSVFLNRIVVGSDSVFMNHTFTIPAGDGKFFPVFHQNDQQAAVFPYSLNKIRFSWSTDYFTEEEKTQYSYYLVNSDRGWSNWESLGYKEYGNLRYGQYRFMIKARTVDGIESDVSEFEFVIRRPWYATGFAILFYVILATALVILIIHLYTRRLRNENIRLEGIVVERTAVVVKQKEELESSIHYASRIQMALLPSEELLSNAVKESFILFKPRDIVSGDFYWMSRKDGKLFVVAADCTGHGVPGAFMSLLGMSFLDEIVNKAGIQRADLILNELRLYVTNSLKQVGDDDEAKDGMDLALMVIDFEKDMIEFSGAYNPCFRVRALTQKEKAGFDSGSFEAGEGEMTDGISLLQTINASKMPIGISGKMNQNFELHEWNSKEKYTYYIFSDGYVDQFGEGGRKFMKKNFKKLLLTVQHFPLDKQGDVLNSTLQEWMGETAQIDDIIVIGFRIN